MRGASLIPPGDVVTADVAREGANPVIDALRDLGVHREGAVRVEPRRHLAVDTRRSRRSGWRPAPARTPSCGPRSATAAYEDSELNWTYLSLHDRSRRSSPAIAIVLDSSDPRHRRHGARAGVRADRRHRRGARAPARRACCRSRRAPWCSGSRPASSRRSSPGCWAAALGWVTYEDIVGRPTGDGVHLHPRPVDLHRRRHRRGGRGAVADLGADRRPVGGVHLGDDGAGGGQHRARRWRSGRGTRCGAAAPQLDAQPHRRWPLAGWATLALQQRVWSARCRRRRRTVIGGRTVIGRPPD